MKKILTTLSVFISSVAMAQTACDSLDIKVHYYPFTDSLIQVDVINNTTNSFFSYPQFTILDSNSDTVAHEQMNFFGIGQTSYHVPVVYAGMPPANTFSGNLQLYYITVDSYAVCNWPMNFDLCPDTCTPFYPHIENIGGAQVIGTANWEILNSSQQVVANGSFTLDTSTQTAMDSVCLGADVYTYRIINVNMNPGGQKYTGIYSDNMYVTSPLKAFNNNTDSISLNLYEQCQTTTSVKAKPVTSDAIGIYSSGEKIYLQQASGKAIGDVAIYSIDGKLLVKENVPAAKYAIDMGIFPQGIYIVRVMNEGNVTVKKVDCGK